MIGGGIVAGHVIEIGLKSFGLYDLVFNYGTIMIIIGAFAREYFSKVNN